MVVVPAMLRLTCRYSKGEAELGIVGSVTDQGQALEGWCFCKASSLDSLLSLLFSLEPGS